MGRLKLADGAPEDLRQVITGHDHVWMARADDVLGS
jgi:hypothetical protein